MNRVLALFGLVALTIVESLAAGTYVPASADATVASVAMGGIRFRKEPRISMEKERLSISTDEVKVEYDFLNNSNADITTDVAFPLPVRKCDFDPSAYDEYSGYSFGHDFRLWVDGAARHYNAQADALSKGHIYTDRLRRLGIDIVTCGHYQIGKTTDFSKLSKDDLQKLSAAGLLLLSSDGEAPLWTVREVFYWKQTFPAGRIVHIAHTYKPGVGQSEQLAVTNLYQTLRKERKEDEDPSGLYALNDACLSAAVGRRIARAWGGPDFENVSGYVFQWVDYVLKTGNNWQGPIKDFELNVKGWDSVWVNFCWNGPVERLAHNHVRVKVRDFTPSKDLHIVFLPERSADSR